jgi:hypothetical protein
MKNYILLISMFWLVGVSCCFAGNVSTNSRVQFNSDLEKNHWTVEQLATLIDSVTPWSSASAYTDRDWKQIIEIAKIFQTIDSRKAADAFKRFSLQDTNDFRGDYLEISKPFLLLRVMYNLPEKVKSRDYGGPGWLSDGKNVNSDGTINLDWPLTWNQGKPSLVARYIGYEGPAYNPEEDYLSLNQQFGFRDLGRN